MGTIWVNEDDEVRIDGEAEIETEESASSYESYVYAIMLEQGLVIDLLEKEQDKPVKFDRTPIARLMDEEDFDLSRMVSVIWVVNTEREQDRLCEIYKDQTGKELYDMPDDIDNGLVVVAEPAPKQQKTEVETVAEPTETKRRLFGRRKDKQGNQQSSDTDDVTTSVEN